MSNASGRHRHRVLVVDDDHDIRESIVEILGDFDIQCLEACNGQQAIERLRERDTPCVMLLDLMMPMMDGRAVRAHQRGDPRTRDIPVVVLTAHGNAAEAASDMEPAAALRKPIKIDALLDVINALCRHHPHGAGR